MPSSTLTPHDAGVLSKIKDPESSASPILVDSNVRRDPHILDPSVYDSIVAAESAIIKTMITLEKQKLSLSKGKEKAKEQDNNFEGVHLADDEARSFRTSQLARWLTCIIRLDKLIEKHPNYASAKNNRVQALRAVYGDGVLVTMITETGLIMSDEHPRLMEQHPRDTSLVAVARKILGDLSGGIDLLTPRTAFTAVSPTQARTLSHLYMQRGQLYRVAAQKLARNGEIIESETRNNGYTLTGYKMYAECRVKGQGKEAGWSSVDFEEHASRDFMMAGRYGHELGQALAVATNPNAKLCGQIVNEAMRKEFAGEDSPPKVGTEEDVKMEDVTDTDATMQKLANQATTAITYPAVNTIATDFADTAMDVDVDEKQHAGENAELKVGAHEDSSMFYYANAASRTATHNKYPKQLVADAEIQGATVSEDMK